MANSRVPVKGNSTAMQPISSKRDEGDLEKLLVAGSFMRRIQTFDSSLSACRMPSEVVMPGGNCFMRSPLRAHCNPAPAAH
jgi:hypothetical protein